MEQICVALDVEMTGPQVGVDEIIEVAAVKFRGHDVLETFTQLVQPRQSLPLKITRLTGITADALAEAPDFNAVAPDFVAFIKNHPLVGHSVETDLSFLRAQGISFNQPAWDTFDLATLLLPQAPVYRLSAVAEYLGLTHPDEHRALTDADVSRQVFLKLVARIEALDLRELAEIDRLMARTDWSSRDLVHAILRARTDAAWNDAAQGQVAAPPVKLTPPAQSEKPLKPTGQTRPLDVAEIAAFFGADGPLSQQFANYEQRPPQVEMAQAVTEAFNASATLLVEAGTGTGKSMAYLVPAARYALQRGERVVLSTNTINLQDQLYAKDIPDVARMLAAAGTQPPLQAALLKGRSNYLCLKRYKALQREENLSAEVARALLKVRLWLPTTTSGDRAELLLFEQEQVAWGRMNVTVETCTARRCPDFHDCFFFRARDRADAAHMVVVNHALLLADLAAQSQVLPEYDHLIIDEAHNLEEVATEQLGFRIDRIALLDFLDSLFQQGGAQAVGGLLSEYQRSFQQSAAEQAEREQADKIAAELRPMIARARQQVDDCFTRLAGFATKEASNPGMYDARLRLTPDVRRKPDWATIAEVWQSLDQVLTEISGALGSFEALLLELEHAELLEYDDLLLRVQALRRYASEVCIQTRHIIFGTETSICWISMDQFRSVLVLNAAPLSVAAILQPQLFAEKQTVVLTSATLSINESFEFVRGRLGLDAPRELQLGSPFDYEQQALVFIPDDIPEPNQQGYQQMVEDALINLCQATGGRTLALFTASATLRGTYAGIHDALEEAEITVLGQGIDGSRRSLLERFREWPRTMLLGTSSFWEGIDVVGDALSVLVITKLPFHVPSDPVFAARSEQFSDPFLSYAVPQSILRFKQGFGRLIRSRTDRGVVVVLDKRLISKRYGSQFLQSLPPTSVRRGALRQLPALAARFLNHQ